MDKSTAARLAALHLSIKINMSCSLLEVISECAWLRIWISLRNCIISRVREGLDGALVPDFRVATFNLGRDSEGVAAFARWGTGPLVRFGVGVDVTFAGSGAFEPGGSEDGGSEPTTGLTGVRKGDLNGLCSVLVASSSRRRFASGVDIFEIGRAHV